jgi:hypothetical protein
MAAFMTMSNLKEEEKQIVDEPAEAQTLAEPVSVAAA